MNYRRITGLFGAAGALAVGTEIAQAQEDLGASIADAVTSSVASIDTDGDGDASLRGGVSTESTETNLGEQTGVAIADASGGNNNLSFVS